MHIAIISDLHFGTRSDSSLFLDSQERFFKEIFFPYIDENKISTIINLGDTFDRRKFVNFVTLFRARKFFFDEIAKRDIEYHAIAGNHDVFYRNLNTVNAVNLLLGEYPNFHHYVHEPIELQFDSVNMILVPWMTNDNREASLKKIAETEATILAGHLELTGFEMDRGSICDHGMDRKLFTKFDQVWSGHFHHPSKYGNIEYLGATGEMTWSDYDGVRGFHVFDTETRTLLRIHNTHKMFIKLHYDDSELTVEEINDLDLTPLSNAYIKIIVNNKTNPYLFDLFLNRVQQIDVADVKIVEDVFNLENVSEEDLIAESKDTKVMLHEYVDSMTTSIPKNKVKSIIDSLYTEAMNL